MNRRTNKYIYEFVTEKDGEEITKLLEKSTFNGEFCLVYTKRPNAYLSLKKESENFAIVIGRDKNNGKICGMGICSINEMMVNGVITKVAYLSGFRREDNVGGDIIQMYKMLGDFCKTNNVKYTYTTILEDNIHVQKMLTKRRKFMPDYIKISDYTVNIFKSDLKSKCSYICEKVSNEDLEKLKIFIKNESQNKIFFPYIETDNKFFGLDYKDFYVLKDKENNILACGILWNQKEYKQLIVKKYSLRYRIIRELTNFILRIFNYPILPKENEIIDYSTLSFVLYKDDNEKYLTDFIREISHKVKEKMFVYASTKELSKKITPMKYKSYVYIVDWDKKFNTKSFDKGNLYIECGLL